MKKNILGLAVFLLLFGAFYRVLRIDLAPGLPNFSPVMAIALCGGLFLPLRISFLITLPALIASDIFLNAQYHEPLFSAVMLGSYACYALGILMGQFLKDRSPAWIFGAVVGNAAVFYVLTNTLSWLDYSRYPRLAGGTLSWIEYPPTAAGWIQSLTIGIPGYPPTWTFFRNSLISDLIFTGIFLGAVYLARNLNASPNLSRQESSSCLPPGTL